MSTAAVAHSSSGILVWSLLGLVGAALLAEIVYTFVKLIQQGAEAAENAVRALLALVLVGAVVVLAGAALGTAGAEQTSNLLIGGVVASAASAVAFYFASRNAQTAQQNVLDAQQRVIDAALATPNVVTVPYLSGLTVHAADANLRALGLDRAPGGLSTDAVVVTQNLAPGKFVPRGTVVTITTRQP